MFQPAGKIILFLFSDAAVITECAPGDVYVKECNTCICNDDFVYDCTSERCEGDHSNAAATEIDHPKVLESACTPNEIKMQVSSVEP